MTRSFVFVIGISCFFFSSCRKAEIPSQNTQQVATVPTSTPTPSPTPAVPNLQAELLDDRNTSSTSPIAKFDFRNYTYELPRGWQNPDGTTEIKLTDGRVAPVEANSNVKISDNSKAKAIAKGEDKDKVSSRSKDKVSNKDNNRAKTEKKSTPKAGDQSETSLRRIGMSLVATKFFDVTGDGDDEAIVVLKIETGGSAIPQIVHVFSWNADGPELIWPFRTGDRADGGLKNIFAEGGNLVVELYGQDRFLLGQTETARIGDDIEQICCPTHFTRTVYKWNGKNFLLQGKRLTYLTANPSAAPLENIADKAK